jgi:hypothetical protein
MSFGGESPQFSQGTNHRHYFKTIKPTNMYLFLPCNSYKSANLPFDKYKKHLMMKIHGHITTYELD